MSLTDHFSLHSMDRKMSENICMCTKCWLASKHVMEVTSNLNYLISNFSSIQNSWILNAFESPWYTGENFGDGGGRSGVALGCGVGSLEAEWTEPDFWNENKLEKLSKQIYPHLEAGVVMYWTCLNYCNVYTSFNQWVEKWKLWTKL